MLFIFSTSLESIAIFGFRYDYENVDAGGANLLMSYVESQMPAFINQKFSANSVDFTVQKADNFEYHDPIDHSVSKKQVLFISIILS